MTSVLFPLRLSEVAIVPVSWIMFWHDVTGCALCVKRAEGAMVIEAGVVAGYVIAWAVRKARRVGGRLDAEADGVIDAGLDRLHEVVAGELGGPSGVGRRGGGGLGGGGGGGCGPGPPAVGMW